jgi:radical SAM superfamily enzyme YgiQ (UPF0313 family)
VRVLLVYFNPVHDLLPAPPIGLAYVASATAQAGHAVRLLDLLGRDRPFEVLQRAVRDFAPEVVGFSVRNIDNIVRQRLTWYLGELRATLAAVRRETRAPIVLGGPAVSILGGSALAHVDADFAVVGEGEVAFPRLLSALATTRRYDDIAGLCYREAGTVRCVARTRLPHFGASGMERWIEWPAYERRGGTWAIQTKRGCPLHCSYCAYPGIEGRAARARPAAAVADEIERVTAAVGPRTFELVDSTFNVPTEHAVALCEEIIRRRLDVNLTAMGVNPAGVTPELFPLMRRAGFNSMMITPEAASDTMLRSLRKGFTVEHVRRTAALARQSGIASAWFFMLGGPGETRETVEETVSFAERHLNGGGCVSIFMTGIRILPGTELARQGAGGGDRAASGDLAEPAFYLSPAVDEDWILRRISTAIGRCPAIVHAADEGRSVYVRLVDRALYLLGVAPPYWRFLPALLRVPPVPALRRRATPLGVGGAR